MAKFPYTITENNITVFVGGTILKLPKTHAGFRGMADHLQGAEHDETTILELADKREALSRLMAGKVSVIGKTVYYAGVPVHSALADRLIMLTDLGHDATPWAKFMDKIGQNPSQNSRDRLFEFIDRWETPLTPDGDFIAFKGVREDYSSTRKAPDGSTVYNRPGDVVSMPRENVVEDPNITCASGLHACASHYLDGFWRTQNHVVAVKINPADVVSIPIDYNLSKMRVCRYEVLGDIVDERHRDRIESAQIVTTTTDGVITAQKVEDTNVVHKKKLKVENGDDPWGYESFYYEEGTSEAEEPSEVSDTAVTHEATGRTFDLHFVNTEVGILGQRGFSRKYGVPRTTVQDWLKRYVS